MKIFRCFWNHFVIRCHLAVYALLICTGNNNVILAVFTVWWHILNLCYNIFADRKRKEVLIWSKGCGKGVSLRTQQRQW